MKHWAAFIGNFIASHVLVDDTKIPYEHYERVKPHIEEIESWSSTFEDLQINEPHTWVKTGKSVLEKVSRTGPFIKTSRDIIAEAMSEIGYEQVELNQLDNLFKNGIKHAESTLIYNEKNDRFYQFMLPNDVPVFMRSNRKVKDFDPDERPYENLRFYLPNLEDKERLREAFEGVGELFWKGHEHLVLDKQRYNSITYKPIDFPNRGYEGDALEYIDEWEEFMEEDVRRCILLQGEPGTGKSTLARQASIELSNRTIHLTQEFITHVERDTWTVLNDMLQPDVIVVDDIDRVDRDYLRNRLYLFEDAYHQVPLTIMTANHYSDLPDAFLRPGRIDQILQMDDPDDSIKENVIKEMAKKEGIENIPDEQMEFLLHIYKNYSGAYIVEYLRRVKVMGWDYRIPERDLTFEDVDPSDVDHQVEEGSANVVPIEMYTEEKEGGDKAISIEPDYEEKSK